MSPVRVTKPSSYRLWRPLVVVSAILALSGLTACSAESTSAEGAGEKTMQSAAASPTWTPNIPKKKAGTPTPSETKTESTESTSYETPDVENAVLASELLNELYSMPREYIVDGTYGSEEEQWKVRALYTAALMIDALKTREGYLHNMEEYKRTNPLLTPLKEMNKWQLAQALDYPINIALTATEDGHTGLGREVLDKERATRIVAVTTESRRKPQLFNYIANHSDEIERVIDPEDKDRTAEIIGSHLIDTAGMEIEKITVRRTSSPEAVDCLSGITEWEEDVLLIPISALDKLPVIYGTSKHAEDHSPGYNRPRFSEELGTYVTSDGKEVLIPVPL